MEKINFESLRQEDLGLRRRKDVTQLITGEEITDEEKDKVVGEIKKFIAKCREAGNYIPDEEERDFLRAILRHWGTVVYNASGVYPYVDLDDLEIPAPKMRIKFSPVSLLVAGVLVLLVGAVASPFVLDYLSVRQTPTPEPQPTFALEVSPGTGMQVGNSVVIVAKVEPLEKLDLKWSVSGTAEGKLNTDTGEQVVYTAGKEGTDIVVAEGTTASGAPVKQTVTLTVVGELVTQQPPTDTPSPTPTETLTPPCTSLRPPIVGPSVGGEVKITSLENCTTGPPSATSIPLAGTYRDIPEDLELWILVYPPNLVYYPQSSDACKQLPAQRSGGQWNVIIRLGRKGFPEQFDIVAVLVDTQASQAFKDYLKEGCDTGSYQGFSILPEGQITEMDSITVFTKG